MDKDTILKAETAFSQALEYFLGVEKSKNMLRARDLLRQSAEMGLSKAAILLGDWYIKGFVASDNYKEALAMYRLGCDLNDPRAFSRMAMCYGKGYGVKKNPTQALRLYIQSANMGYADACFDIARSYEKGRGVEKDLSEACAWYEKGTEMGDADCACNLAFCYFNGIGTSRDIEKARTLFLQNSQYNAHIQRNLGVIYYKGTEATAADKDEAIRWFASAANNGDGTSMRHLGEIYWATDKEESLAWYRRSAEVDKKQGAYTYAFRLYQLGEKHWLEAFDWMKVAAEKKHTAAQFMLGLFYKCGNGTDVDHANAFYWFKLAAENGYEQAFSHVGRYFRDGRIVKTDYEEALLWFDKALHCSDENVYSEALYDYGVMYLNGYGVKKDRHVAKDYLIRSKELGCINAERKLKDLGCELTSSTPKMRNHDSIKKNGNILEYVEVFMPGALAQLNIYIEIAKKEGLVAETNDERLAWKLTNKDLAQWVLDVSDALKLFDNSTDKTGKRKKKYWAARFARLFISKRGKVIKAEDLRHNMSEINNSMDGAEVKNIDLLMEVQRKVKEELRRRQLL